VTGEVEPERNHLELPPWSNSEADEVVDRRLAHADQAVADPGKALLGPPVDGAGSAAEVPLEDVGVVGVDDRRPGAKREGGSSSNHSRLRGMGVDDVRAKAPRDPADRDQR